MPSYNAIVKTPEGNVPNAAAGKVNLFVDFADDILKGKDELGAVKVYDATVAASLGNVSANPAILSASAEPSAVGHIWAITTVGPPHAADLVDPRASLVSNTVVQLRPPVTANDTVAIGELLKVNLDGAAGDVDVALPPAGVNADREVWIKIVSDGFPVNGRKVVIVPDGADTGDGLAAGGGLHLEMLTNYEWRKLRATGSGTWMVVG
jgi:hypothetical protein